MRDPGKGTRWLVFVLLVGALMLVGTAMAFADEAGLVLGEDGTPGDDTVTTAVADTGTDTPGDDTVVGDEDGDTAGDLDRRRRRG